MTEPAGNDALPTPILPGSLVALHKPSGDSCSSLPQGTDGKSWEVGIGGGGLGYHCAAPHQLFAPALKGCHGKTWDR